MIIGKNIKDIMSTENAVSEYYLFQNSQIGSVITGKSQHRNRHSTVLIDLKRFY